MKNFNEKTLVEKLDKILRKKFGTNLSFKEFSAGYGIADLVFAPDFSFSRKKVSRLPITNFNALKILISIEEDKKYTLEEILNFGNITERKSLIKQLNFLVKNGYIKKDSEKKFEKIPNKDPLNPIKKIIAIEVKLTDHVNGLIQAKRYQYFADESYLAILKKAEKNINAEEFNQSNIGLILFDDETGKIEIKYPEKVNFFQDSINLYARGLMLEKFLNLSL